MNSETRKAVDKAQNAAYNENVKAGNVTVLNRGATLYAQLGMKQKKAEAKAAVVQKVVEGKAITTEELKSLNLTDPKARDVFAQLTGYVFPENTKVLEDRATQMAHMKRVPEVMAENARVQNEVAAAQEQANVVETAAVELVESVSPAQVSEDITQTEDGVQAAQEAVEVAEERDPGEGPADFGTFAQAYRERVNPEATDEEIQPWFDNYIADAQTIETSAGMMTRMQFRQMMRQTPQGQNLTDEQLNQFFDYALAQQGQDGGDMFKVKEGVAENGRTGESETEQRATSAGDAGRSSFAAEAAERGQTVRVFEGAAGSRGEGRSRLARYREVTKPNENAAQTVAELEALGIPAFVYEGDLEVLASNGKILSVNEDAVTINKSEVAVSNDIGIPARETAGHEAFHRMEGEQGRTEYEDAVIANVDVSSEAFAELMDLIEENYFPDGDYDSTNPDHQHTFNEELRAYISGFIHANAVPEGLLYDEAEVRQAWEKLIEARKGVTEHGRTEETGADRTRGSGAAAQGELGGREGREGRNAHGSREHVSAVSGEAEGRGENRRLTEGVADANDRHNAAPFSYRVKGKPPVFTSWTNAETWLKNSGTNLEFDELDFPSSMIAGYMRDGQWKELETYPKTSKGLERFNNDMADLMEAADGMSAQDSSVSQVTWTNKETGEQKVYNTVDPEQVGMDSCVRDAQRVGMKLYIVTDDIMNTRGDVVAGLTTAEGEIFTEPDIRTAEHEVWHGYTLADSELHFTALDAIDAAGKGDVFDALVEKARELWGAHYVDATDAMLRYMLEGEVLAEAKAGNPGILGREILELTEIVRQVTGEWEKDWDATHAPGEEVKLSKPLSAELEVRYAERDGRESDFDFSAFEESDGGDRYKVQDPDKQAFRQKYDEMYGEGASEQLFAAANEAFARAREQAKTASAKASGSVAQADDGMTGWVIYGRNPESVGAARLGFDPYSYLQNTFGTIEQTGKNNHRIVDVPKSTNGRDKVSKTTSTVMGAKATPDERLETIAQAVVDGKMSYYPVSNKITENKMRRKIEKDGWSEALKNWTADVRDGKANADLVAMGATLLNNAGNSGMSGREYTALMMDYAQLLRNAGQALQAANIFKKMSPEAKLYGVQKQIDRINEDADIRTRSTGIPVDLWMDRVGELLADKIYERIDVKEDRTRVDTVCDTILKDLYAYAKDLVAKESTIGKPVRTEMERLQDLFRNKNKYKEAWQVAKDRLTDEFGTDPNVYAALEAWIKDELPLAKRLTKELTGQNEVVMSEALAEMYLAAETEEQQAEAMDLILQNIADQIPATKMDKFTALRYMNMLGNLRSTGRNILGNAAMVPIRTFKATFAGLGEALAQKAGLDFERTTSVKRDKETLAAAAEDFKKVRDIIADGGRYADERSVNLSKEIRERKRVFKNAFAEGWRKRVGWMMDNDIFGDAAFSRAAYRDALARHIAANGTTWSEASEELKDRARVVAIREAAEATYRDNNALSETIVSMRFRNPKNWAQKGVNLIGEGIMPFRKTPANILVRSWEYSPLGIFSTAIKSVHSKSKGGEVNASDIINAMAKSVTGTSLLALGFGLYGLGCVVTKNPGDDDKEKELWEMQCHQEYSLEFTWDGKRRSYTIDWLAPASIPFLVGASLAEALEDKDLTIRDAGAIIGSVWDPLLEMSMLQDIEDAISNAQTYGDDSALVRFIGNALWSYATQAIPTLAGQVERAGDNIRMTTYVDKNKDVPDTIQRALGKASAKIPGWDYGQTVYVDA